MKKKLGMFIIILILIFPVTVLAEEGSCPLGPDVTKDLYGALKIFNIVAPVLCIGLSIYEAVKAITKGDASTDLKKVAGRFGKRVIYTIILIFLPLLVDQMMQIADVWGANGTCDLTVSKDKGSEDDSEKPGDNKGSKTTTKKTTTTKATTTKKTTSDVCASYDATICDVQPGCYWNGSTNKCTTK